MENKEEILEEIEDINEEQTTAKANVQIDNMLNEVMDNTSVINTVNNVNNSNNSNIANNANNSNIANNANNSNIVNDTNANNINNEAILTNDLISDEGLAESKKSKTVIIIILSVLLMLDIIALVIYLIGLDKLGFIQ